MISAGGRRHERPPEALSSKFRTPLDGLTFEHTFSGLYVPGASVVGCALTFGDERAGADADGFGPGGRAGLGPPFRATGEDGVRIGCETDMSWPGI